MASSLRGGIIINEILAHPNTGVGFDTDGDGTARARDEFVELYNEAAVTIDIGGLQFWDAGRDNWHTIAPGTMLAAGAHYVVVVEVEPGGTAPGTGSNIGANAGSSVGVINNGGDNVIILDPIANQFIQATFGGDAIDDPTAGGADYVGFPATATLAGPVEDFGATVGGRSVQRVPHDGTLFINNETPTPGAFNICFVHETQIKTSTGYCKVDDLRIGQQLLTLDHKAQSLVRILSSVISAEMLLKNPLRRPVIIAKNALGPGMPRRALRVSQQHRMLISGMIAQRMFGRHEVLAPAKDLLGLSGITLDESCTPLTYYHLMCERHEIIFAEDAATESLYLGPQTLATLSDGMRDELMDVFPKLRNTPIVPARKLVKGKRARNLIGRHAKNAKPLVGAASMALWL